MSHTVETCSMNAPNPGCNRALVLSPFTGRDDCLKMGGNYQCCRIPDLQMAGSQLLELKTQFTVDIRDATGNILFEVVPTPHNPVRAFAATARATVAGYTGISFGGATRFNGINSGPTNGLVAITAFENSTQPSVLQYRVVSMGLSVQANQQVMNQAGTIAACNVPPDPYEVLVNNTNVTAVSFVESQPGAITAKTVDGIQVVWTPHSNCCAFAQSTLLYNVETPESVSVNQEVSARYEDWLGFFNNGGVYDKYEETIVFGGSLTQGGIPVVGEDLTTKILVAASGFSTTDDAGTLTIGALTCALTMHLEILPRDVGRDVSPGALGVIPRATIGAPSRQTMTEARADSLVEFATSLGGKAAKYAGQLLRQYGPGLAQMGWSAVKTMGPMVAGLL